jgi:hypothetical protein
MQHKIVDLSIFKKHNGPTGFLANHQPFTKFTICLLILTSGCLKVMRIFTGSAIGKKGEKKSRSEKGDMRTTVLSLP